MSGLTTFLKKGWNKLIDPVSSAALILILFLTASCSTGVQSLSETLASRSAKTLRENAVLTENIDRSETIVLLGSTAGVFFLNLAEGVPEQVARDLSDLLNQRLGQMVFFKSVQKSDDIDQFFKKNRSLNQLKSIYLESLTRVSVSNKDISNRMGKHLKMDNLVVFQIDRWPCLECKDPVRLRVKMRVVDASSGLIVWTGINEFKTDKAADMPPQQVFKLSEELLDRFQYRFQRKWHRLRFQNLALLTKK
ncbi:hypothetical protein KKI24_21250 [bacterium]|nr:hypothetical protein [bacterium]